MAISFGLGLTAYKTEHELVNLREFYHPKSAQGMAFVSAFDPRQRSLAIVTPGPHHGVDQVMPTILDSREHMFFQVRHSDQDSTLNDTPHERVAASLARLDKLPVVRAADISAEKWPSLIEDIVRGEPVPHELSAPGAEPLRLTEETVLTFPLDSAIEAGLVEFEFEFESKSRLQGGFAVISYELHGAEGIDPEDARAAGQRHIRIEPAGVVKECARRGAAKPSPAGRRQHLRHHAEGQEPSAGRRFHPLAPASCLSRCTPPTKY